MRKSLRGFAVLAAVALGAALAGCSGGAVATVNGQAISQSAFDAKLESSPFAKSTLQQMVQDALITQYAKRHNITVSTADIAKKEDQIKANFPNGSWDQMLKARGLTEKNVHDALREQIIIDKAVGGSITITPAQISQYFQKNRASFAAPMQVKARHILVGDLATADKVEGLLKKGGDFAKLAQQYSIDPGSKANGGELGWFKEGQMVAPFWKAASTQAVGVIGPPVRSPFGYHIIKVQGRKPAIKATLANSSAKIKSQLRQQQEAPLIQPFLLGLTQKARIATTNPAFAGLFPTPTPAPAASIAPAASVAPAAQPTK